MRFGTKEYMEAFQKAVLDDPVYRSEARTDVGSYTFVADPEPARGVTERHVIGYREDHGEIVEFWEGERPTEFTISGPYGVWVSIMRGELAPIKAVTTRKMNVRGALIKLIGGSSSTSVDRLVEIMRTLPTEFEGEYAKYNLPGG